MAGTWTRTEWRRFGVVLVAGWIGLVVLHLALAADVTHARLGPGDQWGYWGNARFIAGDPGVYALPRFPYFTFGYSIVLAPIAKVAHDPDTAFLAVKVLNACLAASLLPLLYAFGRVVLRADRRTSLLGAAAGALAPGVLAHTSSILAENLVYPLVVVTVLGAHAFLTERPAWQRAWLGPSVALLFCVHNRFVMVLPVLGALLVLAVVRRRAPLAVAALNAGAAGAIVLAAVALRDALVAARWAEGVENSQGGAVDTIDALRDPDLLPDLLLTAVGQLWYLIATTFGLSALGLVLVAQRTVARDRSRDDDARWTLGFVLASAVAVFALSVYIFTKVPVASEAFIAGRHNDSFVPLWVAAGVMALLGILPRERLAAIAVAVGVVLVGLAVWVSLGRSGDMGELYSMLNVPGVVAFVDQGHSVVPILTVIGVGAMVAVAAVSAWRSTRVSSVLVGLACVGFVVSQSIAIEPGTADPPTEMREELHRLGVDEAAIVQQRFGGVPVHYQFFISDVQAIPWDTEGQPPSPFVLAELTAPFAARGARVAALDDGLSRLLGPDTYSLALWVFPGPEQDRLAAAGDLLDAVPADSPS